MQGQGQGQVVQRQDGDDDDGQPVPDADRRAAEWRRWRSSRYGRGGRGGMAYGALCIGQGQAQEANEVDKLAQGGREQDEAHGHQRQRPEDELPEEMGGYGAHQNLGEGGVHGGRGEQGGGVLAVPAHTYEQVVEGTMMTLLSDAWSTQVTLLKQEGDG